MPVGNVSRINSDKFKVEAEFVDLPKANKPEINVRREAIKSCCPFLKSVTRYSLTVA